jgi:hypothetical protein
LPQSQLLAKYRALAAPVLGESAAQALEQRIMRLGGVRSAAGLGEFTIETIHQRKR